MMPTPTQRADSIRERYRTSPDLPIVWSYGGGTQTAAIAVLVLQGRLPRPDHIIMADTGREATATWDYLDTVVQPALEAEGMRVEVAPHSLASKDLWDNAQPSGNSVLAEVFAGLAAFTGEAVWSDRAEEILRLFQEPARRNPVGYGYLLQVIEGLRAGPREIAVVGRPGVQRDALVAEVRRRPRVGAVVAVAAPGDEATASVPLLAGRGEVDGQPAAYVCRGFVCDRPVTTPDALRDLLA